MFRGGEYLTSGKVRIISELAKCVGERGGVKEELWVGRAARAMVGDASRTGDGGRCEPHGRWWEVRAARAMLGAVGVMGVMGAGGRENNRKVVASCF